MLRFYFSDECKVLNIFTSLISFLLLVATDILHPLSHAYELEEFSRHFPAAHVQIASTICDTSLPLFQVSISLLDFTWTHRTSTMALDRAKDATSDDNMLEL